MRDRIPSIALSSLIFLAGCMGPNSSHVLNGTARPAVPIETVRTFTVRPANAEIVGMVRATVYGESQSIHDKAVAMLMAEAARIGANGVVVEPPKPGEPGAGTLIGPPIFYTGEAVFVPLIHGDVAK